jgi:hypothetical protein
VNPDHGHPLSRARLLLVAALGSFLWLLLSIFGQGSSATASEDAPLNPLLETISGTVGELVPLPDAAPTIATVLNEEATELNEKAITRVVQSLPIAPVVEPTLATTIAIVDEVALPAVQQTLGLVTTLVDLPDEPLSPALWLSHIVATDHAVAAESAAPVTEPEPAAVPLTAAAADTRAAHVPAAGSPDVRTAPLPSPLSADTSISAVGGGHAPVASLTGIGHRSLLEAAAASPIDDALPAAPPSGSDTSPD